ncbi:hypothetical protein EXIGLDRAFT_777709 [Exidia glandulosa HHB12029]|uniref:F-box domain-containing protein n=1 Tax=Exidia glandulosa HHB12029 TaxID=1314781 RepID=A0A165CWJ6_EXIGL|nr:hypothetical protein EXIGLDRAFT_777709 [Exidia glandulosa HHB12029]
MLTGATSRLPVELTVHYLQFLSIKDLVLSMGVCRSWRALGRTVPTYWRDIELDTPSDTALDLFQSRLTERRALPVNVAVILTLEAQNSFVLNSVLPLLLPHIPRCRQLHIYVHIDIDKDLFPALSLQPAPLLEKLTLAFYGEVDDYQNTHAREHTNPFPPTLFASTAPLLRVLHVRAVDTVSTWPRVFADVTKATFNYGTIARHIVDFSRMENHLPALTDLTIVGTDAVYLGGISFSSAAQSVLGRLRVLRMFMRDRMPFELLHWTGTASVPHIYTTDTTTRALSPLMSHVGSQVSLNAGLLDQETGEAGRFVLRYQSLHTGICRTVEGILSHEGSFEAEVPVLPGLDFLHEKLCRLEISVQLWVKLASRFTLPPLPACTDILIQLNRNVKLADMRAVPSWMRLQCPALRAIELTPGSSEIDPVRRCTSGYLSHVLMSIFPRMEKCIRVTLRSLHLESDSDDIPDWIEIFAGE